MSWALEQRDIVDATARYVLLVLANYADKNGRGAFPSSASISDDTGLSIRTVKYKLDHLLEIGAIRLGNQAIAGAYIDRHDRRPTVYDLCVERGARAAPGSERGANNDTTGCSSRQNGVQTTTERGAGAAPNPSINHQVTTKEPIKVDADAPTQSAEGSVPYEKIRELYNSILGGHLARRLGLNDTDRKRIRGAYNLQIEGRFIVREQGLEFWEGLFNDVLSSPFLLGGNGRAWRADFEFLTRASSIQKFLEGKYDAA